MDNLIGRVTCGDCLEVMQWIDDKSVDLTVTSPPYDNLRTYGGNYTFNFEPIARELYRITKDRGVVIWVVGDATIKGSETGTSFRQVLYFKEIGFNLHDTMLYIKENPIPLTHNRYEQAFEYMFCLSKGKPKTFNPIVVPTLSAGTKRNRRKTKAQEASYAVRGRDEVTVSKDTKYHLNTFYYCVGQNFKTIHNAPFPLELAQDHILSWSNKGDLILDPFSGSGTTGIAAIQLNRRFILIEQEPKYCAVFYDRVAKECQS